MRHKGLILIVLIIAGLSLTELQAQSMVVKENVGIQTAYSLSNISKLSFSSGKLTISRVDSSSVEYALSNLQYLSFSDSTSVNIEQENIQWHTQLYFLFRFQLYIGLQLKIGIFQVHSHSALEHVVHEIAA